MHASFRPVGADDLPTLNAIVNDPEVSRYMDLIPPAPLEKTVAFARHMDATGGKWWCILVEGRIAGGAGLMPKGADTRMSHVAGFFLYLRKEYWEAGMGDAAMKHLIKEAKSGGFARLECLTVRENTRAINLYERNGFVVEGVKRNAFRDDAGSHDLLMMARLFDQ